MSTHVGELKVENQELQSENAKYKWALERIAYTRCAWQYSQKIALKALEPQAETANSPVAKNPSDSDCATEREDSGDADFWSSK